MLLLAAALVVLQWLGLAHTVVHDHARPASAGALAAPSSAADDAFGPLFSGHDTPADCEQFDQITHADVALLATPCFDAAPSEAAAIEGHPGWHLAQQAAGFLARGPPSRV